MQQKEIYYSIFGLRIGQFWLGYAKHFIQGSVCKVEFDYTKVAGQKKFIGCYHTHPHCSSLPSATDFDTMGALVNAEGKPLLCIIEASNKDISCYDFRDDEGNVKLGLVYKLGRLFWGAIIEDYDFPSRSYLSRTRNT